jgi:hypothetical protein
MIVSLVSLVICGVRAQKKRFGLFCASLLAQMPGESCPSLAGHADQENTDISRTIFEAKKTT